MLQLIFDKFTYLCITQNTSKDVTESEEVEGKKESERKVTKSGYSINELIDG